MKAHTYIPPHFCQYDPRVLSRTLAAHPFAAVVLADADELCAVHLPFLHFGDPGKPDTWRFESHLARANPVAQVLADGKERSGILIFTGPDAYLSPRWYAESQATSVPTWNYQAVHVRGRLRLAGEDQPGWLDRHLHDLIDTHQARIGDAPFDWDHLPARQIEGMKAAIVGIELLPERIEGIEKLGQNKTAADRDGVIEGLRRRGDAECDAMAELMRAREKY